MFGDKYVLVTVGHFQEIHRQLLVYLGTRHQPVVVGSKHLDNGRGVGTFVYLLDAGRQFCHFVGTHIAVFQFFVGFFHDFSDQFFAGDGFGGAQRVPAAVAHPFVHGHARNADLFGHQLLRIPVQVIEPGQFLCLFKFFF